MHERMHMCVFFLSLYVYISLWVHMAFTAVSGNTFSVQSLKDYTATKAICSVVSSFYECVWKF